MMRALPATARTMSAHTGAVDAELAQLEAEMADTKGPYWSGPDAEAEQERYRQLLEALNFGAVSKTLIHRVSDNTIVDFAKESD